MVFKNLKSNIIKSIPSRIVQAAPTRFLRFKYPSILLIEVTNICNLNCLGCPTPKLKRKRGFMKYKDFKAIIDEISKYPLKQITFTLAGEPLFNKDFFKMVKYASDKSIFTFTSTNTTLLHKYIDDVFDSGLDRIIVCLDGASKKTHEAQRGGSNFYAVKRNIKMLCNEKSKRNVKKPEIVMQCIATKNNEHEINDIIKLAKKLGVDALEFKSTWLGFGYDKISFAKKYLPTDTQYSRYVIENGKIVPKKISNVCSAIKSTAILWNGDIVPCCNDFEGRCVIGNVFKDGGLLKVFRGEKYLRIRKKILKRSLDICKCCNESSEYIARRIVFKHNIASSTA